MELFDEIKNSYYASMHNILNKMILGGEELTYNQIIEYFRESAFNIDEKEVKGDKFINNIFHTGDNIKSVALLKKTGDEHYTFNNSNNADCIDGLESEYINPPQIYLTALEKRYIKTLLEDKLFVYLIGEELSFKLTKELADIEPFNWSDSFISLDVINEKLSDEKIKSLADNINIIKKAINGKKVVVFSSVSNSGEKYVNQRGIPYKIFYSPKNKQFFLNILIIDKSANDSALDSEERAFKNGYSLQLIDVLKIYDLVIANSVTDVEKYKTTIQDFIDERKQKHTLILEVEEIYSSLERCFSVFSYYDKQAEFDKQRNLHIVKIEYYQEDISEIIRDILSLGDAVLVKEPEDIRLMVIERIKKAYMHY